MKNITKITNEEEASDKAQWTDGVKEEIDFWDNWFKTQGGNWKNEFESRTNPTTPLIEYLRNLLPIQPIIEILDVGSGPISMIGRCLDSSDKREIKIYQADALGDEYEKLLKKYNINLKINFIKIDGERLTEKIKPNTFDIVHCNNALDHCYNPLKAVEEMIKVVKSGGVVYTGHQINEAEAANYGGLHQWNIDEENNHLIFWNKRQKIDVNNQISKYVKRIEIKAWRDDRWIVCKVFK